MALPPERWDRDKIIGWASARGLDATIIPQDDFEVNDNHDGTWTVVYKEFIEQGPNGLPTKTEVKTILVDTPPPPAQPPVGCPLCGRA